MMIELAVQWSIDSVGSEQDSAVYNANGKQMTRVEIRIRARRGNRNGIGLATLQQLKLIFCERQSFSQSQLTIVAAAVTQPSLPR
jgi:hypothetical protein